MVIDNKPAPMAAMGSYDSILPFQAIGMETVIINAENHHMIPQLIAKFVHGKYAILFMEESLYAEFINDVEDIIELEPMSIIPLPNQSGSLGIGTAAIKRSAERAVGMDIFNIKE